jgi:hypothetical protein
VCATLVVVCALIAGVTCVGCNTGVAFLCRESILVRYTCIFSVTDVRASLWDSAVGAVHTKVSIMVGTNDPRIKINLTNKIGEFHERVNLIKTNNLPPHA